MTERIVTDANGRKHITTEKAILNKNLDDDYKRITELEAQSAQLLEALKLAEHSLGAFVSDHGWSQQDMDNLDTVTAAIAQAEKEKV